MARMMHGLALAVLFAGCASTPETSDMDQPSTGVLRHVVLLKFRDDADPRRVQRVEEAFRALPEEVPIIRGFEWGTNVSPEGKTKGYTHLFFVTFDNAADRDAYLIHPAHMAFGETLRPILDDALVFDYETREQGPGD